MNGQQPQPLIPLSRERVVHDIELAKSKIQLHEALIDTHIEKDLQERMFFRDLHELTWRSAGQPLGLGPEHPYLRAMANHNKAQLDILQVQLLQFKGELQMLENILREGDRQVITPGTGASRLAH